jgi:hypothetical protein
MQGLIQSGRGCIVKSEPLKLGFAKSDRIRSEASRGNRTLLCAAWKAGDAPASWNAESGVDLQIQLADVTGVTRKERLRAKYAAHHLYRETDGTHMAKITLEKHYEVRHWMRTLACSELELREAIKAVGPEDVDVRRHLQSNASPTSRWNSLAERAKRGSSTGFGDL